MNLEQISTFLQVYQCGSFQEASLQLYLPQPTVSHRIAHLEKELGKTLLIRSKGAVRLTEEGKAFLPYARNILGALQEGREAVLRVDKGEIGKLSLGCYTSITNCLMPHVLDDFRSDYPNIPIKIFSFSSAALVRMIKHSEIQLAITRSTSNDPSLIFQNVFTEPNYAILSSSHRLAKRKKVTLEELLQEPFVTFQKKTQHRNMLDVTLNQHNLVYKTSVETNSLELIKYFLKRNAGVHVSGTIYMHEEIRRKELVPVEIESNPFPLSRIFMVRLKGKMSNVETVFSQFLIRKIQKVHAGI